MTSMLKHVRDRLYAKLSALLPEPTPNQLIVNSVGQEAGGVAAETVQAVMEWLFASLMAAEYNGRVYLLWLHPQAQPEQNQELRQWHRRGEPVLGYRCGDRMPPPPSGFYWRLMPEHPSMRIYQLEVKEDG